MKHRIPSRVALWLISGIILFGVAFESVYFLWPAGSKSPREVAQAFVDDMIAFDFSQACSRLSNDQLGAIKALTREDAVRECALNYTGNVGFAMATSGIDPFVSTQILEGYERKVEGGVAFTLIDCAGHIGAQDIIIRDGQVAGFETQTGLKGDSGQFEAQCTESG